MATHRLQLLIFMLLGVLKSISTTKFLPLKQRPDTAENISNAVPQLSSRDKFEMQFQSTALGRTMTSFLVRKRQENIFETWSENVTLGLLLVTVVRQEFSHCDLVLACSDTFCRSSVLHTLLMLPNLRQVST